MLLFIDNITPIIIEQMKIYFTIFVSFIFLYRYDTNTPYRIAPIPYIMSIDP